MTTRAFRGPNGWYVADENASGTHHQPADGGSHETENAALAAAGIPRKERKTRTITLTDRPPVKIYEDEWPVIATATGDSWTGNDYARYRQADAQGELDGYTLRVRQHQDGRAIVYGILDAATAWTHSEDWKGGELLDPGADIAAAIRRIGQGQLPDKLIRECIADLPAQEI